MYYGVMSVTSVESEIIRRSISLPPEMAEKIDNIAVSRHVSGNRAIVDLLVDAFIQTEQNPNAGLGKYKMRGFRDNVIS